MDWQSGSIPASTSTAWKWSDSSLRYPLYGASNAVQSNSEASELMLLSGAGSETYYPRYSSLVVPAGGVMPCVWSTATNPYWAYPVLTFGASYAGAYMRCNLDGSVPLWPTYIYMGRYSDGNSNIFAGTIGKYPFVGRIPAYDASGTIIVKQQVFRDAVTRRRIIAITGGALEDASNFYGLELA